MTAKMDQVDKKIVFKRWYPVVMIMTAMVLVYVFDLDRFLGFEQLKENRELLLEWVEKHPLIAPCAYMLIYTVAVALSLPGGAVLTVAGGFLFGALFGTLYTVLAATAGATLLFVIASSSLGSALKQRAGPWLAKMQKGFNENATSYLLVLRLIPIFPFWLVNLAPAFLGVRLKTYLLTTFVGIIPGTFVFALIGSGLGSVFDDGDSLSLQNVMTPQIIGALIGLAMLSLLPVIYKKFRGRGNG